MQRDQAKSSSTTSHVDSVFDDSDSELVGALVDLATLRSTANQIEKPSCLFLNNTTINNNNNNNDCRADFA